MNFKYSLLNTAALTSLLLTVTARADLPLSLEGIAPKRNRLELGLSLSYYNRSGTIQNQGESSYFMTPQNTLVEIPGRLQEGKNNSDILYTSLNAQYGLSARSKIYTNIGGVWRNNRYSTAKGKSSHSETELSNITLGINHVFMNDGENPAVIGVLETSALDKINGKNVYGRSWFLGINTYKAVDPIVFSFTGGYRFNLNNSTDRKVGNYWLLRPGVSFAANDRTTLSANLKWTGKNPDRIKGKRVGAFASDTYADLGVGYSFTNQTSISVDAQWNISGDEGSNVNLSLQHRF